MKNFFNTDAANRAFGGGQVTVGLEVGVSLRPTGERSGGASTMLSSGNNHAPQRNNESFEDLEEKKIRAWNRLRVIFFFAAHGQRNIAEDG